MPPKPERGSDTPVQGRIGTNNDHSDAQETNSTLTFFGTRLSPEDARSRRAFSDVIRNAIGEYVSITELSPEDAAKRECVDTLKSLHRRGRVTFDEYFCQMAAYGGQLEVLKWLRDNTCQWNSETTRLAAYYGGQLEVLKLARAHGCPWDMGTCVNVADGGQLEVLQWAHANGCAWEPEMCTRAAWGGTSRRCSGHAESFVCGTRRSALSRQRAVTLRCSSGVRERLPLERGYVFEGGLNGAVQGAAVGTRERLSAGKGYLHTHGVQQAP